MTQQQKNDQARGILAKLRLEPAVFLFFTCFGLFFASSQQLYIEKACKVYSLLIVQCTREKKCLTLLQRLITTKSIEPQPGEPGPQCFYLRQP